MAARRTYRDRVEYNGSCRNRRHRERRRTGHTAQLCLDRRAAGEQRTRQPGRADHGNNLIARAPRHGVGRVLRCAVRVGRRRRKLLRTGRGDRRVRRCHSNAAYNCGGDLEARRYRRLALVGRRQSGRAEVRSCGQTRAVDGNRSRVGAAPDHRGSKHLRRPVAECPGRRKLLRRALGDRCRRIGRDGERNQRRTRRRGDEAVAHAVYCHGNSAGSGRYRCDDPGWTDAERCRVRRTVACARRQVLRRPIGERARHRHLRTAARRHARRSRTERDANQCRRRHLEARRRDSPALVTRRQYGRPHSIARR